MFATSFFTCQCFQLSPMAPPSCSPPASSAARAAPTVSAADSTRTIASARLSVRIVGQPFGHFLHGLGLRVEEHADEEREVENGENPCEEHVDAFGRLQS